MSEQERDDIRRAFAQVVGDEKADRLMEQIPPFSWDEIAKQGDLVAMRADMELLRADVNDLRTDVNDLRTDVHDLRTDVHELRTDVSELRTGVNDLRTDVRIINQTLDLRFDSLRDGLSAQFHADLVAHARMMFFSMLGAVFTAASLAFAAVRL